MRKGFILVLILGLITGCGGGGAGSSDPNAPPNSETEQDPSATEQPGNTPPVAVISNYGLGIVGSSYTLRGDSSTDADGDLLVATWALKSKPAESSAELVSSGDMNASFTPDAPGDFVVELTVSDGLESGTASMTFTATTPFEGTLDSDVVFSQFSSPYMITGNVTIPAGRSLSIEPGVTIHTSEVSDAGFKVYAKITVDAGGALSLNGTSAEPITVYNTRIGGWGDLSIAFSHIKFWPADNGCCVILAGVDSIENAAGKVLIQDSRFEGSMVVSLTSPSQPSLVERNDFRSVSLYAYANDPNGRYEPSNSNMVVKSNLFDGTTLYIFDVEEQQVQVSLNSFLASPGEYGIYMDYGSQTTTGIFVATDNYWGTGDAEAISDKIYHGSSNGYSSGYVQFDPYLMAPSPDTPSGF